MLLEDVENAIGTIAAIEIQRNQKEVGCPSKNCVSIVVQDPSSTSRMWEIDT